MNPAGPTEPRILFFSRDSRLLYTRRLLLEDDGWTVDIVSNTQDLQKYVATRLPRCGLVVLCHSLPRADRQSIQTAAKAWPVKLYSPTPLTKPAALQKKVAQLMDS